MEGTHKVLYNSLSSFGGGGTKCRWWIISNLYVRFMLGYLFNLYSVHPPPSQIEFAPVKPHGFPTFLHGKTPVFQTPFPKAKAFLRVLPPKGDKINFNFKFLSIVWDIRIYLIVRRWGSSLRSGSIEFIYIL